MTEEKNISDPRADACNLIINSVMAFFFYTYAFNNPDFGACFAKTDSSFKIGKPTIPVSVPSTIGSDAVYATGYVDVSIQFQLWFTYGFLLCCATMTFSVLALSNILTLNRAWTKSITCSFILV